MTDVATGTLREDILNEKVMSAIVEIKVPVERTEEIIRLVWEVEKKIDTVVALGVGTRCDENGEETWSRRFWSVWVISWSAPRPTSAWAGSAIAASRQIAQETVHRMTNTLHRFGDAESFRDDYVVFAIASKGKNDQDSLPKLRRFLEIAAEYQAGKSGRCAPWRRAASLAEHESACRTGSAT